MAVNYKVGEISERTGLTVRTLHHYDEIGLLKPSSHSPAGYRLYTAADLGRLQQILSLRQIGLSLEEIRGWLDGRASSPLEVIRLHVSRLRERIDEQRKLCDRLEALADRFRTAEEVSAEELLQTIEVTTMIEKYYTPDQLDYLAKRREEGGAAMQERIEKGPQLWADLFADVRKEMEGGTEPSDPKARALAKRWMDLITEFTGGDPGVFKSLRAMYASERNVGGVDAEAMRPLNEYIQKAADAAGIRHPGQ